MKNKLKDLLENFQVTDDLRAKLKTNEAPAEVKQIAASILCGCFKVSQGEKFVRVQPTSVEFYCHEEQADGIKDYIVYHKNNTSGKKDIFPVGILHNHVSGIDITFEKGEDKESAQRLSFLVREFKIIYPDKTEKIDKYPTHLYDALYSQFSIFDGGFNVEWVDGEPSGEIVSDERINVPKYEGEKRKTKDKIDDGEHLTANDNYVQDEKLWKFSRK